MQEIGFSLYSSMLDTAIQSLKQGKEPDMQHPLGVATEINLHVPALLPDDYCHDIHERLVLYKRMANCTDNDQLDDMHRELIDRFGLLPNPTRALIDCHRLRIAAKPLGITRIDASADNIQVQFIPNPPIDPARIIKFIQSRKDARLAGPDKLRLSMPVSDLAQRVTRVREVLKALS